MAKAEPLSRNGSTDQYYADCFKALIYLWGHPGATWRDVKYAIHASDDGAKRRLGALCEWGFAHRERDSRKFRYYVGSND